eukprot:4983675-Ditylum_brightwellii.AAC.1
MTAQPTRIPSYQASSSTTIQLEMRGAGMFLKAADLTAVYMEAGLAMSPVKSMHDSTGAYLLIFHKFCPVVGVSIARANAQLWLRCLC